MKTRDLSVPALLVTVVLWASAFVGIRAVSDTFSAGSLSLGRLVAGSIALTAIAWPLREPMPTVLAFIGGGLCLLGVTISRLKRRTAAVVTEPSVPVTPTPVTPMPD